MPDSSADRDPLDRLAEEFVDRYRAGQRPALSEFILRQPDRADEIRELFPALVEMEQLKPVSGERTGDFAPAAEPSDPQRVGEFRILRRVGHGGMGVVYEAVQESLGRHVALKLMPLEALADPKRLERFRREAKAAARLHHTNIVPVFGTGEADGRHFYAMQFIDGHPLDAVIDEVRRLKDKSAPTLPRAVSEVAAAVLTGHFADPAVSAGLPAASTSSPALSGSLSDGGRHYWETVARLGAQAADALAYAHAQGVQHRDIKPSNLLLDLQGTVWVTDFGLAKATDTDDLTHSGDVVGTLRYLAPERFDGPGDHRSDVYSLGLTVYELLTLRPAFAADVRAKLVEQVVAASPPKPRSVSATIPRDLETVVLKATARDPAMRYASAAELADDLRRFVQDRPIQARRASAFEQTWRWCRRNPAVASLLAAVVLITAGGFATTAYQAAVAREEARRADENAAHAEERAEEVLREKRAQEALNQQLRSNQDQLRRTLYSAHMNQAQSAWQGENYSRVLDLLEQHRPKADEPDLRSFEWHYWKRQAHKDLAVFRLPSALPTGLPRGAIVSTPLALSDDGARVASLNASQGLQVWDVATGRRLAHCPDLKPSRASGPGFRLNNGNLMFSPDGRRVAFVVSRGEEEDEDGVVAPSLVRIVFVEAEGGRELYHIDPNVRATGRTASPMIMDFSPDGKLFAVGVSQVTGPRGAKAEPTTIAVHDLTARARLFQQPRPDLPGLARLKFRPDGRQLEVLGRNPEDLSSIRLVVDAITGKVLPDAPIEEGPARTRSPDGRRSVTRTLGKGQRGVRTSSTITVTADGKEVWKGQVSTGFTSFRFSPDGKRLVGYSTSRFGGFGGPGGNAGLRVWNADTGEVLPVHIVLSDALVEVAFRPDGKLVTLDTGAAKTWELAPPPMAPMTVSLAGPSSLTGGPAVTPDGRFCVSNVGLRQGFGENPAEKIDDPEPAVLVLAEPGREVLRVPMKGGNVSAFASPPTALSADGSTLAIGGLSGARGMEKAVEEPPLMTLWDVVGKREIGRIASPAKVNERGPLGARRAGIQIAFSPDGRLVALTRGRVGAVQEPGPSTITVWDVATQKPRHTVEVKAGTATSLAFSPDGRRIAATLITGPTFANETAVVQVFDLASGGEVRKFDVPFFAAPTVKYSPDGKWLAVYSTLAGARGRGRESSPQLWPAEGGREPVELTGSAPLVRDLAFSPDSQRVAVLSSYLSGRSEVKVWDPPTGRELLSLPVDQPATAVRFSADGQALYVFSAGGRLTFDATALSPEVEASDVADRLSPAETRDEILAEIDRLALSKGLKARVAELARPVPFLRSRPTGPAFLSLQAGRPEGEYKAGLAQYEEQVKSRPKSSTPWGYLGMYRYRLGKFDEALEALVKAQELTTEAQRARTTVAGVSRLVFLAMAQQRLGRADEAKATLARAREVAKSIGSAPVLSLLKEAEELVEPRK